MIKIKNTVIVVIALMTGVIPVAGQETGDITEFPAAMDSVAAVLDTLPPDTLSPDTNAGPVIKESTPDTVPSVRDTVRKAVRPERLIAFVDTKKKAVVAGNALFFSGAIIYYGLVLPQSLMLELTDLEGQLALVGPSLLASGLRYAGTPMSCMRVSEVGARYEMVMGEPAPRPLAWTLYFSGWGFTVATSGLSAVGLLTGNELFSNAALGTSIAVDVVWAVANVYAAWYLKDIRSRAETARRKQAAGNVRLSVVPAVNASGAPGIAISGMF